MPSTETSVQVYSVTFAPAAVAANTTAEQTFAVPGLQTNDTVLVTKSTFQAGLGIVNARVSAAGTLAITYINCTAAAITPPSENYSVVAIRS